MSTIIGTVTINRNPSNESDFWKIRLQQDLVRTADGGRAVYDSGPTELHGVLVIANVAKSEADSLRTYLVSTAVYQKNSFTITPPSGVDIGGVDGVALSTCYFDGGDTIEGVLQPQTPRTLYTIRLPYMKVV